MVDIRWLRNTANAGRGAAMTDALHQAIDEIERLRAELAECKESARAWEAAAADRLTPGLETI